jgi:hypothetical protein
MPNSLHCFTASPSAHINRSFPITRADVAEQLLARERRGHIEFKTKRCNQNLPSDGIPEDGVEIVSMETILL